MKNIAIFASGNGSNAVKIMERFKSHPNIRVKLIVCNNEHAGILEKANQFSVPTFLIRKSDLVESDKVTLFLLENRIDLIVLAGFLLLIPLHMVKAFPNKMVNIHPALLPKYGGKGMHGMNVHRAVKKAGEAESGISIHFVNEHFDEGEVIFQATCSLDTNDNEENIASKVLQLEHKHFSEVIEKMLQ